jgi:LuxR family transcriptional regulator, maltose regulon positive regulatory protein
MHRNNPASAKYSMPRVVGDIVRTRLFRWLDGICRHGVAWISGPPGSGKTRLIATYLEHRSLTSRWYHVDAGDRDPAAFFQDLGTLASDDPSAGLPVLTPDQSLDLPTFARRFFRRFFSLLPGPCALVLEDCHVAASPAMDTILMAAIDETPGDVTLIVLSRMDPGPALARHRVNGRVATLPPGELAFSLDEAMALAEAYGITATSAMPALLERCEGWSAGLALLLRAGDAGRLASDLPRELLNEYFTAEVLDAMPTDTRKLLLATAALPSFTAEMAHALTGMENAGTVLAALHAEGGFVAQHPGTPPRYRCQPLFREILLERAVIETSAAERNERSRLASCMLAAEGDLAAAFSLCRESEDPAALAALVGRHAHDLLGAGRHDTLRTWLSALGDEAIAGNPWLTLWQARCDTFATPREAMARIGDAHREFVRRGDTSGAFHAAVAAIESGLAQLHDLHSLDPWIDVLAGSLDSAEDDADRLRAWYAFLYAALSRAPGHPRIAEGIQWVRQYARMCHRVDERTACGVILIYYAFIASDPVIGQEIIDLVEPRLGEEATPPMARWLWHYWRGLYHLWRIEYPIAAVEWETCLDFGRSHGLAALDFLVHARVVMIDLAEDRLDVAEARLATLRTAYTGTERMARALYWLGEMFLCFHRNQRTRTREAMEHFVAASREAGMVNLHTLALTDVAALHLLNGEIDHAEALLRQARELVRGTVVRISDGQIAGIETAIAFARGQPEVAKASLLRTLTLVEQRGMCGCLMWVRTGFSALFSEAWRTGVRPQVIRELIRRFEIPPPTPFTQPWPWPIRIHAFDALDIEIEDRPWRPDGKPQHRVLDLLRLLIAEGGRDVSAQRISDRLWPDTDGDAAMTNVRGTVKRLRDMLGDAECIRVFDGKVSLNRRIVWIDTWALGELLETLEGNGAITTDTHSLESRLFALYRAPLLAAEDHAWLIDGRQRQRDRFARGVQMLVRQATDAGDIEHALNLCDRALGVDPQLPTVERTRQAMLQRITPTANTTEGAQGPSRLH